MLKLPRLAQNIQIVGDDGRPTTAFIVYWQQVLTQIEATVNGIQAALDAAGIAQQAAATAQAAAETAQSTAAAAQTAADTAQAAAEAASAAAQQASSAQSLATSGIMPRVVVHANASGTITIDAHTRYYGNGTSVAVGEGVVSGLEPGDPYYVYYEDAARAGGAVEYQADITFATQTGDRHNVGSVTIPMAGSVDGQPGPPPPGGS